MARGMAGRTSPAIVDEFDHHGDGGRNRLRRAVPSGSGLAPAPEGGTLGHPDLASARDGCRSSLRPCPGLDAILAGHGRNARVSRAVVAPGSALAEGRLGRDRRLSANLARFQHGWSCQQQSASERCRAPIRGRVDCILADSAGPGLANDPGRRWLCVPAIGRRFQRALAVSGPGLCRGDPRRTQLRCRGSHDLCGRAAAGRHWPCRHSPPEPGSGTYLPRSRAFRQVRRHRPCNRGQLCAAPVHRSDERVHVDRRPDRGSDRVRGCARHVRRCRRAGRRRGAVQCGGGARGGRGGDDAGDDVGAANARSSLDAGHPAAVRGAGLADRHRPPCRLESRRDGIRLRVDSDAGSRVQRQVRTHRGGDVPGLFAFDFH